MGYIRYTIDLEVLSNELSAYHIQLQPLGQHGEESFAAHLLFAQLHSAIDICGMILRVGHDNQFAEVAEYLMAKGLETQRERARVGVEPIGLACFTHRDHQPCHADALVVLTTRHGGHKEAKLDQKWHCKAIATLRVE